jgi:murein DD-endopeptidase MepM/ murein hydrolase activator NlpD
VLISQKSSSYGNYIVIDHGGGRATLYAHLSKRSVNKGDSVKRGDKIGEVGSTGLSTGPHLHFECQENGEYKNPINYLVKQ